MQEQHANYDSMAYWKDYYSFWDAQIREWFNGRQENRNSELAERFNRFVRDLVLDDMPEPYYGFPHKGIKAVALHHNPGISKEGSIRNTCDERQKYFSLIDDGGWLVRKFRDKCDCSYQNFVENYSCLIPGYRSRTPIVDGVEEEEICGVDWWQGLEKSVIGKEVKWLGQIYGMATNPDDKRDATRLHPLDVFVLELCPFHSEDFKLHRQKKFLLDMNSYIMERVFKPTIRVVRENNLPFAVARGAKFKNFLESMNLQHEKEWSHKDNVEGWPKTKNNNRKNTNRTYRLYTIQDDEGEKARLLVTWYQAAYDPPNDGFKQVERLIRDYVQNNPLG